MARCDELVNLISLILILRATLTEYGYEGTLRMLSLFVVRIMVLEQLLSLLRKLASGRSVRCNLFENMSNINELKTKTGKSKPNNNIFVLMTLSPTTSSFNIENIFVFCYYSLKLFVCVHHFFWNSIYRDPRQLTDIRQKC